MGLGWEVGLRLGSAQVTGALGKALMRVYSALVGVGLGVRMVLRFVSGAQVRVVLGGGWDSKRIRHVRVVLGGGWDSKRIRHVRVVLGGG